MHPGCLSGPKLPPGVPCARCAGRGRRRSRPRSPLTAPDLTGVSHPVAPARLHLHVRPWPVGGLHSQAHRAPRVGTQGRLVPLPQKGPLSHRQPLLTHLQPGSSLPFEPRLALRVRSRHNHSPVTCTICVISHRPRETLPTAPYVCSLPTLAPSTFRLGRDQRALIRDGPCHQDTESPG